MKVRGACPAEAHHVGGEGGFTLVEVLVALVVTVAALTVLAQGFSTGARSSVVAQSSTRAAILAQQVLTDFETAEKTLSQSHSGEFAEAPGFRFETRSEAGDPGLTKLTITVLWQERNQEQSYALTRLMRERPTP